MAGFFTPIILEKHDTITIIFERIGDMTKVEFNKPFEFEGVEHKSVELDLDSLKGSDISSAKKQWQRAGNAAAAVTMDIDFCIHVATMACDQPIEFFNELPAKEYNKVYAEVFSFLNG